MHSWAGGGVMWWLTQVGLLIVRQLTETKGKNTQFTILHFLKKEVQTKKEHLLSFYDELPNVEKASKRTCVCSAKMPVGPINLTPGLCFCAQCAWSTSSWRCRRSRRT